MLKRLIILTLFFTLIACEEMSRPSPLNVHDQQWATGQFEWDPNKYQAQCSDMAIDPIDLLPRILAQLRAPQDEQYFYLREVDLRNPTHIGYRSRDGEQYLRYDFLESPDGEYLDGGVILGVEACSGKLIFEMARSH